MQANHLDDTLVNSFSQISANNPEQLQETIADEQEEVSVTEDIYYEDFNMKQHIYDDSF